MKFQYRCSLLFLFLGLIPSCASQLPQSVLTINSPLGIYRSNTQENYWLAIQTNRQYMLCSPQKCYQGIYQIVPANYGVILLDFYLSDIGLAIERLSHGSGNTDAFFESMKQYRLQQSRANDQVFNLSDCGGIVCVGIGHRRNGVKFYRVENFDRYWKQ